MIDEVFLPLSLRVCAIWGYVYTLTRTVSLIENCKYIHMMYIVTRQVRGQEFPRGYLDLQTQL